MLQVEKQICPRTVWKIARNQLFLIKTGPGDLDRGKLFRQAHGVIPGIAMTGRGIRIAGIARLRVLGIGAGAGAAAVLFLRRVHRSAVLPAVSAETAAKGIDQQEGQKDSCDFADHGCSNLKKSRPISDFRQFSHSSRLRGGRQCSQEFSDFFSLSSSSAKPAVTEGVPASLACGVRREKEEKSKNALYRQVCLFTLIPR